MPAISRRRSLTIAAMAVAIAAFSGADRAAASDQAALARGFIEKAAAEEAGGVAEEAGAHRVALARDGIRPGARSADVARHQRQVDDGLRGADALITLVHAHRPPERNSLAFVNRAGAIDALYGSRMRPRTIGVRVNYGF